MKSHTGRNIAVVVLVIVVLLVVVWFFAYGGYGNQLAYPNVSVSGQISTVGFGTTPFRIDFTSNSGSTFSATVTGGYYSITLPNHDSYTTTVDYNTAISSTGSCNGGVLSLNVAADAYTFNTSC